MNTVFAALYVHVVWPLQTRLDGRSEDGLEAVEYALIAALIAVSLVTAIGALRGQIETVLDTVRQNLGGAATTN